MSAIQRAVAAAALACASGLVMAGPGYWTGQGPWGGVAYDLLVPAGPGGATTAYVLTRGGMFRTPDGGLSWTRADIGIPGGLVVVPSAVLDDLDPARIVATDYRGRLYRSTDAAATWIPGPVLPADLYAGSLADVPGDSTRLFMGLRQRGPVVPSVMLLHRSDDGGASFAPLPSGTGLPTGMGISRVAVDPENPDLVLAGAARWDVVIGDPVPPWLFVSTDGGASWTPKLDAPSVFPHRSPEVFDIAFGAGSTIYVGSEAGLFRSDDDGATWQGPYGSNPRTVLAHPVNPLEVFVGGGPLARSTDGGVTWNSHGAGLTANPNYTSADTGQPAGLDVAGLAASPTWPASGALMWVASSSGGVHRSTDGGATWSAANQGIGAAAIRALAVHPNPSTVGTGGFGLRLLAGFGDAFEGSPALFLSTNAGGLWTTLNNQLRASQVRTIAIDPTTAGTTSVEVGSTHIYAGGGSIIREGFFNGGLYKSTDGGFSWTVLDGGLPLSSSTGGTAPYLGTIRSIVLDPRSCTIPPAGGPCASGPLQRVYATTTGHTWFDAVSGLTLSSHRIIRSDDAGATWTNLDGDLPPSTRGTTPGGDYANQSVTPLSLALGSSDPDLLYVGTFPSFNGTPGTVPEDRASGVFRSDDGGITWVQRSNGLPRMPGYTHLVFDVLALAIHPLDDNILWASIVDIDDATPVTPLYKTVDGGLNWTPSASGIPTGIDLRALLVDPGDPDILYASGYYPGGDDGSGSFANPPGVFRSDDGGATWLSISSGLTARSVLAMALDPFQPQVLHLGTNTGVWSMEQLPDADGDGVPDLMETFAPNGGDGDGDGIADALQAHVGSMVPNLQGRSAKGAGGYTTSRVTALDGACAQAVDVQAVLAARYGRDYLPVAGSGYHQYPRDLVRLEVMDCAAAEVELVFHGASFTGKGWSFRMYGPATPGDDASVGWHDLSARASKVAADRWRLVLERDQPGSYRSGGDSILFMGGPACHDARIFENRMGDPVAPGCDD